MPCFLLCVGMMMTAGEVCAQAQQPSSVVARSSGFSSDPFFDRSDFLFVRLDRRVDRSESPGLESWILPCWWCRESRKLIQVAPARRAEHSATRDHEVTAVERVFHDLAGNSVWPYFGIQEVPGRQPPDSEAPGWALKPKSMKPKSKRPRLMNSFVPLDGAAEAKLRCKWKGPESGGFVRVGVFEGTGETCSHWYETDDLWLLDMLSRTTGKDRFGVVVTWPTGSTSVDSESDSSFKYCVGASRRLLTPVNPEEGELYPVLIPVGVRYETNKVSTSEPAMSNTLPERRRGRLDNAKIRWVEIWTRKGDWERFSKSLPKMRSHLETVSPSLYRRVRAGAWSLRGFGSPSEEGKRIGGSVTSQTSVLLFLEPADGTSLMTDGDSGIALKCGDQPLIESLFTAARDQAGWNDMRGWSRTDSKEAWLLLESAVESDSRQCAAGPRASNTNTSFYVVEVRAARQGGLLKGPMDSAQRIPVLIGSSAGVARHVPIQVGRAMGKEDDQSGWERRYGKPVRTLGLARAQAVLGPLFSSGRLPVEVTSGGAAALQRRYRAFASGQDKATLHRLEKGDEAAAGQRVESLQPRYAVSFASESRGEADRTFLFGDLYWARQASEGGLARRTLLSRTKIERGAIVFPDSRLARLARGAQAAVYQGKSGELQESTTLFVASSDEAPSGTWVLRCPPRFVKSQFAEDDPRFNSLSAGLNANIVAKLDAVSEPGSARVGLGKQWAPSQNLLAFAQRRFVGGVASGDEAARWEELLMGCNLDPVSLRRLASLGLEVSSLSRVEGDDRAATAFAWRVRLSDPFERTYFSTNQPSPLDLSVSESASGGDGRGPGFVRFRSRGHFPWRASCRRDLPFLSLSLPQGRPSALVWLQGEGADSVVAYRGALKGAVGTSLSGPPRGQLVDFDLALTWSREWPRVREGCYQVYFHGGLRVSVGPMDENSPGDWAPTHDVVEAWILGVGMKSGEWDSRDVALQGAWNMRKERSAWLPDEGGVRSNPYFAWPWDLGQISSNEVAWPTGWWWSDNPGWFVPARGRVAMQEFDPDSSSERMQLLMTAVLPLVFGG